MLSEEVVRFLMVLLGDISRMDCVKE